MTQWSQSEYDRSRIFDIRPKPKFSFKKIRPSAEGISRRYEVSFSSPNSEVEFINYHLLDFCNYLLVAANFPFENNRVLPWLGLGNCFLTAAKAITGSRKGTSVQAYHMIRHVRLNQIQTTLVILGVHSYFAIATFAKMNSPKDWIPVGFLCDIIDGCFCKYLQSCRKVFYPLFSVWPDGIIAL